MRLQILLLLLVGFEVLYGQDEELARVMEDQARQEDAKEVEEDIHQLQSIVLNKVNLNTATSEDLAVFPFLTALQIEQFIQYRALTGQLVDEKELQAVPGWGISTVKRIMPFVTVQDKGSLQAIVKEGFSKGKQQLLFRTALSGNAAVLLRYQFNSAHLQFGVNTEKDAGERFWQGDKGISFLSAHVALKNIGIIKTLVVGDFIMNLGQGLMVWQGRAVRKSAMPIMIKRQLPLLLPYRSNDENRYFRGLGVHMAGRSLEFAVYTSLNKLDANTAFDSLAPPRYVTSFLNTGYHRGPDELADKNAVRHFSGGATVALNKKRLHIGVSSVMHAFSLPVARVAEPYNLYSIKGKSLFNYGLNYHYTWRNMHVFGELAADALGAPAAVSGVMIAADRRLDLSLVLRKISRGYRSFFSNSFTEATEPRNEEGVYTGLSMQLTPKLGIDVFADHYRFPWLRYRIDAPSTGREYMVQLRLKADKRTSVYLIYRSEVKKQTMPTGPVKRVDVINRMSTRLHLEHMVSPFWEWRFRLEFNNVVTRGEKPESGFIMYSDLFWRPLRPFSFNARVMYCETTSYESRMYAYENDVMYYNIIPALYGDYWRVYMNLSLDVSKNIRIFLKISKNIEVNRNVWPVRAQFIYSF